MSATSASEPPLPTRPTLWGVAWPLLASLTLTLSLNFVDSYFLAKISDQAAAAAGALLPLLGATLVVFTAVGQAGASVAAQLLGARRDEEVPTVYFALLLFNLSLGVVTSSTFWALHDTLPSWLGLSGGIHAQASKYLGIIGSFQFLKALQIGYGNILNSRGKTKWVLCEAAITNSCNLLLNLGFLHGACGLPKLGVAGVALATVLSLGLGLVFTMIVVHVGLGVRLPWPPNPKLFWNRLKRVLDIGLPSALEPISYQSAQMTLNALIVGWGPSALAARTYVFNFIMVTTILWAAAFGIGTQVVIAHRVGAEDFAGADKEMRRGLRFGVLGNLAIASVLLLLHRPLLSTLTRSAEIHALASPLFLIGLLVEPSRAVNIVAGGALRSSGDARYVALVGSAMMWCIGVPTCFLLGKWLGFGLAGIWLGLAVDELTRGIVNYRRWRTGRWKDFRVSLRPPSRR
ncbi:MAG: MATE family efflux transporter [Polyangiaceae bacterium]